GYIFADKLADLASAEWIAETLNASTCRGQGQAVTLLFDLAEACPGDSGCQAPLGRRRPSPRPQPALRQYRPPSPTLVLLAQIRTQVCDDLGGIRQKLDRIDGGLARHADVVTELTGLVERLVIRVVALERAVGICEAPVAPRPNRRRPVQ
ncbi:MAG: hypothetical protein WB611_00930, partial [Stellaceae bacterium]